MAFKIITGVKETVSGQSGTGSFSLDGADGNYLAVDSQLANGDSSVFIIRSTDEPETQREVFVGTLTTGTPDTLSRDRTIYSSNGGFGGSSISLDAGKTYVLASAVDPSDTVLDITSLTAETSVADGDEIAIYDAGSGVLRKMTRANLFALGFVTGTVESTNTSALRIPNAGFVEGRDNADSTWQDIVGIDTGDTTLFRAKSGYSWQDSANSNIMTLSDGGVLAVDDLSSLSGGVLTVDNDQLARTVNSQSLIQSGQESLSSNSTKTVTFPRAYSAAPDVFVSVGSNISSGETTAFIAGHSITTSQFVMESARDSAITIHWLAIGEE